MVDHDRLAQHFETHRTHLRAVAYRMLGSLSEADDAVQEAWLHLSRSDTQAVVNLGGWLTTVVARVCLDLLRTRKARREESLDADAQLSEPLVRAVDGSDPEDEALLAESVGLALLVVLDALTPAERLAFVLHDVFAVPFDEIAPMVGRSATAARQLASRARRRVHGVSSVSETEHSRQREVVDAFLAAARGGDFTALLAVLDPDVVLRADGSASPSGAPREVRGAAAVAEGALLFSLSERAQFAQMALVNGSVGVIVAPRGRLTLVLSFTITDGKILELDVVADRVRLGRLDLAIMTGY